MGAQLNTLPYTPERRIEHELFGSLEWDPSAEICFPAGIPGFEDERRFVAIEIPRQRPLVYLQSLQRRDLCFLTLPAQTVDSSFRLDLEEEERSALCFGPEESVEAGRDVLSLSLLIPAAGTVRANLSAPILINLRGLIGVQRIPAIEAGTQFELTAAGMWERLC